MSRKFNILLLSPETEIGQTIIQKLTDYFHHITAAVPAARYSEGILLPPVHIVLHLGQPAVLAKEFSRFETIIACSPSMATEQIKSAALNASATFINAAISYPEAVAGAVFNRLSFTPTAMEAYQSAAGLSLRDIWHLSHQPEALTFPSIIGGTPVIEQESISLDTISVVHRIEFTSRFYAILFWLVCILLRVIFPFFKSRRGYSSKCRWRFVGRCLEHHQEFTFVASSDKIDADLLRPDLALQKALNALGIPQDISHGWGCCYQLKVRLLEYKSEK